MRPGQNNNNKQRMRGRNNRKSPNPLTRSYESNGPDVKIRGTAHHVAEKYLQLARDAQSSGDPVMAESYLQHAEHYFRLIASAYAAQQQAQVGFQRNPGDPVVEEDDEDDDFGGLPDRFASPPERAPLAPYGAQPQQPAQGQPQPHQQPQPYQDRAPYNGDRQHQPNQDRPQQQSRGDRQNGHDRPYQDRNGQGQNRFNQNRGQRDNRPQRDFRNEPQPRMEPPPMPGAEPAALPSFITSPVRVPAAGDPPSPAPAMGEQPGDEHNVGGYHLRPRRRRNRQDSEAGTSDQGAQDAAPASDVAPPYQD